MIGIGNNRSASIIINYVSCEVLYTLGRKWQFL